MIYYAGSTTDKTHLVLVNAIVVKNGKILVSQRSCEETHEPGKWTIPGGKVEKTAGNVWHIIEKTLKTEVLEETGIEIEDRMELLTNNTFIRSTSQHVISLVFLCRWKKGEAKPLEDTINIKWISKENLKNMEFAPNVETYLRKGFDNLRS